MKTKEIWIILDPSVSRFVWIECTPVIRKEKQKKKSRESERERCKLLSVSIVAHIKQNLSIISTVWAHYVIMSISSLSIKLPLFVSLFFTLTSPL